ncbi:MAG: hypothetical protein ACI87J_001523 [Colwellia sp.]|jgi:hypothetical protein
MQVDITNVLKKIKEITVIVKDIDAQDVKPADMKSMNHFKKYTDGIMDHLKANPVIDPALLEDIKETMLEYRNALNEKHGEAQGKSDFISEKCDDIHLKYKELVEVEEAIKKSEELKKTAESEEAAKNTLADPKDQPVQSNSKPDEWQKVEMNLLTATLKIAGFCLKNAVVLPCHVTAAVIGTGAGIIANTSGTISAAYNNKIEQNKQRMVNISPEDEYVTKNSEGKHIEVGGKLLGVLRKIGTVGSALVETGGGQYSAKILESLGKNFDKLKEAYLESCISLSDKSKDKFLAINDSIKKISAGLSNSFKDKLGSVSDLCKGWASKLKDSLSLFASKISSIIRPTVAQGVVNREAVMEA